MAGENTMTATKTKPKKCKKDHLPTEENSIYKIVQEKIHKRPLKIFWYMLNTEQVSDVLFLVPSLTEDGFHLINAEDGTCSEGPETTCNGKPLLRCYGYERNKSCSHVKAVTVRLVMQARSDEELTLTTGDPVRVDPKIRSDEGEPDWISDLVEDDYL
jgi:hypothetical protein